MTETETQKRISVQLLVKVISKKGKTLNFKKEEKWFQKRKVRPWIWENQAHHTLWVDKNGIKKIW